MSTRPTQVVAVGGERVAANTAATATTTVNHSSDADAAAVAVAVAVAVADTVEASAATFAMIL